MYSWNFRRNISTSPDTFQRKRKLSNFERRLETFQLFDLCNCPFQLPTLMLVTDAVDEMCWRQL